MTNKTKLIKSFAGYPVWEYQLNLWEYCCIKDWSYKIHPDIVQWMPSYFEEVKEEWRRMWLGRAYRSLNNYGAIMVQVERNTWIDNWQYEYWNYYETDAWAQAVASLRKHVYKFPMCKKNERNWWIGGRWRDNGFIPTYDMYSRSSMCLSATEEDRAERLRLIEDCIRLNWYLTI